MPLHRDIYWVGRQWAVTGHGIQAVDQRLKGAFDVDLSRIWRDDLQDGLRGLAWFNEADFEKALASARARFPKPAQEAREGAATSEPLISATAPNARLQLRTQGQLAKFVPQWRIRR